MSNSTKFSAIQRTPDFESGIITEPLLLFGGQHHHVDPKVGLGLYGPYGVAGQARPLLTSIIVGIVGSSAMVADAEKWLQSCQTILTNDGSQPYLYPHFPGFNTNHPFKCDLIYGDTWREIIKIQDIEKGLSEVDFHIRIKKVVELYIKAIEVLAQRDPKPHIILCCISEEIIDYCTVRITKAGEIKRRRITPAERRAANKKNKPTGTGFTSMDPSLGLEEQEGIHHNLRRGLKAEAMQFQIPTQVIWPRTLDLISPNSMTGKGDLQDIATRAWNFTTALYHKAGGSPWRLAHIEPGTCFVGISFYKEVTEKSHKIKTSMAQAFTSAGDGYVLRGDSFEWDESKEGKSPHLDKQLATTLMRQVIDLYQRQSRGSLPSRVVVHKTSKYYEEELEGFQDACQLIPRKDFIALGQRHISFYRKGIYPPVRGTYIKFSDTNLLLYTVGYIPFLKTYPGARIPQPIEILEHYGDSPWNVILQEILALTKMNWNTADFACSKPITIAFSKKVGQILAELPESLAPRPEYRFYM